MKTALVLGATGGVGGEVARRLLAGGWTVRALARNPGTIEGIEWIRGDAMQAEDVLNAARGTSLIVHAVNPPGYRNWGTLVLPMIDNTIAAARASGARVLLPGTVYNYGSGTPPQLSESTPQQPSTRKGAIRVEMERRLQASGVRTLIVRAGDFFGPRPGNNWFSQGLIKPNDSAVTYPGAAGTGHAWAYLPDVADTMVRLVEQEEKLATFETFHFRGHWDSDGTQMAEAIVRASGQPDMQVKKLWWPLFWLLAPFVTTVREMLEMRYLWREPFALDNAKLVRLLGSETHTPLPVAVKAALGGLAGQAA
ncbi:MAG TPA: NAD(P)H-binding protein [Telluria sp.]|jgi:nucleoside-diphosphate-sugar epimerase